MARAFWRGGARCPMLGGVIETLQRLLVLQERDTKIAQLRGLLQHAPAERALLEQKLAARKERLLQVKTAAQKVETERKNLEIEAETKRTQIGKYKSQQLETRSNEQYSALTSEIEKAEAAIIQIEDQELELMEKYEGAKKKLAEESALFVEFEKGVQQQKESLEARLLAAQREIDGVVTSRAEVAALVAPDLLNRYDRILAHKKNVAIVPLVHDTVCGGCHMSLSAQTVIDTKGAKKLAVCDNCSRILYDLDRTG